VRPGAAQAPRFSARLSGSYERPAWKRLLRGQLLQSRVDAAEPGRVAMEIATRTGPGRNWANLWKPLIDAFGRVLCEDATQPFHPHDDRIVSLSLRHHITDDSPTR